MKKILSFLLSITIICSNAASVSAYADDNICFDIHSNESMVEEVDFDTFATDISELINEYDNSIDSEVSDYSPLKYSSNNESVTSADGVESTNRLIVKSEHAIDTLNAVGYVNGYDDLHILQFENYNDFHSAYEYYSALDCVEYVQEDGIIHESEITEEYFTESAVNYPTQYQSDYFGYSNAKENMASGKVIVAVVDSGVANDHEMLVGRVVPTGFDSINNTSCYDTRGHGTHVAGIIVANTKSNVIVKPYKVLDNSGAGTDTQVYLGIQAAIEDDVDIINLSLSKKGDSEILREVITEAYNEGITVVAAAGNNNENIGTTTYTPSSFPEVISAVSIDTTKYKASTSNWGSSKDLSAPGVNILSSHLNNTYKVQSGTSMAAPFIAAAASYLLARDSTMTPDEVFNTLYASTARGAGSHNIRYVCPGALIQSENVCVAPVITPSAVDFAGYINVEITCRLANAEILYRTSDMANKTWLSYNGPITIDETTTVTAYCICAGYRNSNEVSVKYTENSVDVSLFEVDENGLLIGYTGTDAVVSVPGVCNGRVVSAVSADAFSGNENVTSVTLGDSIVSIEDGAFANCTSLETVNAPSVTTIYQGVFDGCEKLRSLDLRSVTEINSSFADCDALTTVNLGSLKQLQDGMFLNCTSLTTLTLNSLEIVSERAFYGCTALKTVSLPLVTIIGNEAFYGCSAMTSVSAPKLASIGDSAFENSGISSFSFNYISEIGSRAFYNTKLTTVSTNTEHTVGASAFEGCKNLENVNMLYVTSVGERSFADCTALTSVQTPVLNRISDYAFYNCVKLSEITWVDRVLRYVGDYAFYNCKSLGDLDFYRQNNIEYFGESAFRNCTGIKSVRFDNSFDTLGSYAFAGCTSLESIALPSTLININDGAFSNCRSITSIVIPSGVKNIGKEAFWGCSGLLYVFYEASNTNWNSINIGSSNDSLFNAVIHFSKNDHTYKVIEKVTATCAKPGYEIKKCEYCSYSFTTVLKEPHTGETTTVKPTCTEDGYKMYKCYYCDYTDIKETIPATGHSYTHTTVDPTCTEDGYTGSVCATCGHKTETTIIPATGHSYSTEWTIDVQPACGVEGSKSRHCTVCDDKTDITVIPAASSHTYPDTWLIDYNATCTENGLKYRVCTGCGQGMETQVIPALDHSVKTGWFDYIEPTCTEPGTERAECSRCGEYLYRSTPAYGHEFSDKFTIDVKQTCTTDGLKSRHCEYCEEKIDETVIVAVGHIYPDEWTVDIEPTCFEPGTQVKKCINCTEKLTEEIPTVGHIYEDEWTVDVEPTCGTDGSKSRHCINCDDKTEVTAIPATGHEYSDEWIIGVEPTCTDEGEKHHSCIYCGDEIDSTVIDALGHKYSDEWVVDKAPTCAEDGSKSHHCTLCDDKKDVTVIVAPGHNFVDDICSVCGYNSVFDFTVYDSYVVLNKYRGTATSVVVPSTYQGLPVTEMGNSVFGGCTNVKEVIIPDSVTTLGNAIFTGCKSLESVVIGNNVTKLTNSMFYNCTSLTGVVIPDSVTSTGTYVFSGCTSLTWITIPDTLTAINTLCFNNCTALKYVFYTGDETGWSGVNIRTGNNPLIKATMHYNATDHSYEYTVITEPTCATDGLRESKCNVCGLYIKSEVVPAKGHTYSTEWVVGAEPTCTTDGYRTAECSACNETVTEVLPATGHDYPDEWTGTDATCTEDGYKTKVCRSCGDVIKESTSAFGHDYPDEWTVVDPTCTEDGSRSKTCGNCGDVITEVILSSGHDYPDEWTVVDATCTEDGSRSKTCGNCGDVISEEILSTGHDYSEEWTIDTPVTCTDDGEKSHHCSLCGDRADITVIEATGHDYIVYDTHVGHPHTVSYICDNCGESKVESPYLNDCIYCNYTVTVNDAGDFKLLSYIGAQTDALVPATYMDGSVYTIGNGCFKGNTLIKSVVIEDGITSIGSLAFMNCTSLERVMIPVTVTDIGTQAFYGFTGVIYCSKDSFAHQYAINNNIKYVLDTAGESDKPIQDTPDTQIDYESFVIRTDVCSGKDVTDILNLSESAVAIAEASYICGDTEFYGTGTTITVFDGNKYVGEFTLVVNGDVNGDSVCDALDAAQVALASKGLKTIDGAYALAADSNVDNEISIDDYQAVVNRVVA